MRSSRRRGPGYFQGVTGGTVTPAGAGASTVPKSAGPTISIFHVRRIIEQVMHDAGPLMHAVASLDEGFLVLVHEPRPALGHQHDLEVGDMPMPAGAVLRRIFGANEMSDHLAVGRVGDAKIAILEEAAQARAVEMGVALLDMGEAGLRLRGFGLFEIDDAHDFFSLHKSKLGPCEISSASRPGDSFFSQS
jgi:hypothetical protein